jgi:hypothetical protein
MLPLARTGLTAPAVAGRGLSEGLGRTALRRLSVNCNRSVDQRPGDESNNSALPEIGTAVFDGFGFAAKRLPYEQCEPDDDKQRRQNSRVRHQWPERKGEYPAAEEP